MTDINYLAVLVAAVSSFVIGFVWYSPVMFGDIWMKLSGFTKKELEGMDKEKMAKLYGMGFVASLVMAYVLAHFAGFLGDTTIGEGAETAFWLWLGFMLPVMFGEVLWGKQPVKLFLINASYRLVALVVMAMILAAWA